MPSSPTRTTEASTNKFVLLWLSGRQRIPTYLYLLDLGDSQQALSATFISTKISSDTICLLPTFIHIELRQVRTALQKLSGKLGGVLPLLATCVRQESSPRLYTLPAFRLYTVLYIRCAETATWDHLILHTRNLSVWPVRGAETRSRLHLTSHGGRHKLHQTAYPNIRLGSPSRLPRPQLPSAWCQRTAQCIESQASDTRSYCPAGDRRLPSPVGYHTRGTERNCRHRRPAVYRRV